MAGNPFRRPETAASAPAPASASASAPGSGAGAASVSNPNHAGAGAGAREVAADLSIDTSGTSFSTSKPKKLVKKVRIQSPVISPDEPYGSPFEQIAAADDDDDDAGRPSSPPPPDLNRETDVATELRKSFIDSVARGVSNVNKEAVGAVPLPQASSAGFGKGLGIGIGIETGTGTSTDQMPGRATRQAPYNPFARTLASIEGGYGLSTTRPEPEDDKTDDASRVKRGDTDETERPKGAGAAGKAGMDVDAFTRMLMTGTTRPPATAPAPAAIRPTEGSSSESSISRHSLFDPLHEPNPESPRSSYDEPRSSVDSQSGLVSESRVGSRKAKPPPPSHHRGKLLGPAKKGPQTVSFADFDITATPDTPKPLPSIPPSNVNKQLPAPPPPPPPKARLSKVLDVDGTVTPPLSTASAGSTEITDPMEIAGSETQPRKTRPVPPVARRRSQRDSSGTRPRSSSAVSKSSIAEASDHGTVTPSTAAPSSTTTTTTTTMTKPPPPSCRTQSASMSSDKAPSISSSPPHPLPSKPPPPPPSRTTLRGTHPSIARTPSATSTTSLSHRRASPSTSSTAAAPPPPPPPRRAAEKRSSLDITTRNSSSRRPSESSYRGSSGEFERERERKRFSGAGLEEAQQHHGVGAGAEGRAASVSGLEFVPEVERAPGGDGHGDGHGEVEEDAVRAMSGASQVSGVSESSRTGSADILGDMDAFQREIDALRAQIGKG